MKCYFLSEKRLKKLLTGHIEINPRKQLSYDGYDKYRQIVNAFMPVNKINYKARLLIDSSPAEIDYLVSILIVKKRQS